MADILREYIFSEDLVRAVLSGLDTSGEVPWTRITMRPVLLNGRRYLQVQRYDAKHCDTVNVDKATHPVIENMLGLPIKHLTIQLCDRRIQARCTKRGKVLVSVTKQTAEAELAHDRRKKRWIPEDAGFLAALGMAQNGKVNPSHQRKYRQINEFIRAVAESPEIDILCAEPVRLVDFGCGNAYLTFATFHYFAVELGLRCEMVGVDRNAVAVERNQVRADSLGWSGLKFECANIEDAKIPGRPAIAMALHACDTATDDAISRAVACDARLIMVAPCCHHHVQVQLAKVAAPVGMEAAMGADVLCERIGDVLTDTARIALLRLVGYRARVLQFATLTDTAKNLLIRAEYTGEPPSERAIREYGALKSTWQVTPYLEDRLDLNPAFR